MTAKSTTEHRSSDGYLIEVGARFWDNDLRVLEITGVADHSTPYADTGEIQTWHRTTRGISDTLSGRLQAYGRMARRYEGLDASNYAPGTSYADAKRADRTFAIFEREQPPVF